jgi:predicted small secreted protein
MAKLFALLLALTGFALVGCNTFQGAGRDVQAAGEAVEEAAEDVEDDLND